MVLRMAVKLSTIFKMKLSFSHIIRIQKFKFTELNQKSSEGALFPFYNSIIVGIIETLKQDLVKLVVILQ